MTSIHLFSHSFTEHTFIEMPTMGQALLYVHTIIYASNKALDILELYF